MTLFYRFLLCSKFQNRSFQCRQYASTYTKTLNMPVTKFPAYVKQTKRPEHDKQIREVSVDSHYSNSDTVMNPIETYSI